MANFGIKFILSLLVISGIIAFVGDRLGHWIGKRRLTILKLRPRQTGIFFTVITGILIAFATLGFLLLSSQSARLALFGLERLQNEIQVKTTELSSIESARAKAVESLNIIQKDLDKSKNEILVLEELKNKLENQIAFIKKGKIVLSANEVIAYNLSDQGLNENTAQTFLNSLIAAGNAKLTGLGFLPTDKIEVAPEELRRAGAYLAKHSNQQLVSLVALSNNLAGDKVFGYFKLTENLLVYPKGKVLAIDYYPRGSTSLVVEDKLRKLLAKVGTQAKLDGIAPQESGNVGNLPYSKIIDVAKKTVLSDNGVELRVITTQDIRINGPLSVDLKVYYR